MNKGIVIILITGRLKYKYPVGSEPTIQNNLIKPPFITPLSNWPGKPETELQKVISRVFSPLQSHDAADYARKSVKDTRIQKALSELGIDIEKSVVSGLLQLVHDT